MPTPSDKPPATSATTGGERQEKKNDALTSLMRVESLVQIALVLPVATLVGLAVGVGLDRWLNQHWIYIAGLLLGAVAGFIEIFHVIFALNKE